MLLHFRSQCSVYHRDKESNSKFSINAFKYVCSEFHQNPHLVVNYRGGFYQRREIYLKLALIQCFLFTFFSFHTGYIRERDVLSLSSFQFKTSNITTLEEFSNSEIKLQLKGIIRCQITDCEVRLLSFKTILNYTSCLTYSKLLNVSVPQFPYL